MSNVPQLRVSRNFRAALVESGVYWPFSARLRAQGGNKPANAAGYRCNELRQACREGLLPIKINIWYAAHIVRSLTLYLGTSLKGSMDFFVIFRTIFWLLVPFVNNSVVSIFVTKCVKMVESMFSKWYFDSFRTTILFLKFLLNLCHMKAERH